MAKQCLGITAAIEKQHHLITGLQMVLHQVLQLGGHAGDQRHMLDIQHLLTGRLCTAGPSGQRQALIFTVAGIV